MREGNLINDLNQNFTVFVTPNTGLVSLANSFFKTEIPKKTIPLVVSEQWMTAMFWLKSPDLFGHLPMDQVISSAYGLLYTNDKFWTGFVTKLEHLEKKGKITQRNLGERVISYTREGDTIKLELVNTSPNSFLILAEVDVKDVKIVKRGYNIKNI